MKKTFTSIPQAHSLKILLMFMLSLFFILPAFPKLYINEISGNEKWLEVYNDGDEAVDMKGYVIRKTNEKNEEEDFYINTANATVASKGYISWQRDKDCTDGSTFTWGISAKKDVAFKIIDKTGNEEDSFEVRESLYSEGFNRTVGRKTDGAEELVIFLNGGTRDASNDGTSTQEPTENPKKIYVNEINGNKLNKEGENQPKWLEIYNAEEEEVDITNYTIQKIDEKGALDNFFITEETKISSEGFLVWEQDSLCEDNSTFTWGISARKNVAFKIFDANGTLVDHFKVDIEADAARLLSEGEGRTVGREYDGDEKLVVFPDNGTRGVSNGKKGNNGNGDSNDPIASLEELVAYVDKGTISLSEDVKAIMLISTSGKVVLQQSPLMNTKISVNHLPYGIYLLKMQGENGKSRVQKMYIK